MSSSENKRGRPAGEKRYRINIVKIEDGKSSHVFSVTSHLELDVLEKLVAELECSKDGQESALEKIRKPKGRPFFWPHRGRRESKDQ
jgi:hypothetical protein